MPNFNSRKAILVPGIASGLADAAAGPMHLRDGHMLIVEKPDF
jgi:hypothetical protein